MPMKLNVGVSRKIGMPDYGSVGASCNLEMELDAGLLEKDLDGFHAQIRAAYFYCFPYNLNSFFNRGKTLRER